MRSEYHVERLDPRQIRRIRVEFSTERFDRTPHPDPDVERTIDRAWEARLASNPALFNGRKFRLARCVRVDAATAVLHVGLTDYKTYLGIGNDLEAFLPPGDGARGDPWRRLSRKLGVSGIVHTSDDGMVCLRRSGRVGAYPGLVDVPGGHPEPDAVAARSSSSSAGETSMRGEDVLRECRDSIVEEIHAEVNIPVAHLATPLLLGIVYQGKCLTPTLVYYVKCSLGDAEISRWYEKGPEEAFESTELKFISMASTTTTLGPEFTPAAQGCWEIYQGWKN